MVEITKVKWESVGFKTNSVIMCHTPEYSEDLPIAYVIKQWNRIGWTNWKIKTKKR